eukprot:g5539.t1_g5540.t1 g5539_g5540  MERGED: g5539.t1 contig2:736799-741536(+)
MSGYNTFDSPFRSHRRRSSANPADDGEPPPPPHLYASPVVSSALITAFGRPTLIEYDAPIASAAVSPSAAGGEAEFQPIRGQQQSHFRTQSLPTLANQDQPTAQQQRPSRGAGSKSSISRPSSSAESTQINAYTYRVRTFDAEDDHHLKMCQNPDGTYSHVNADGEPLSPVPLSDDGDDDVVDASSGLMMTRTDLKGSVTLDTITSLRETLTNYDDLPLHVHPTVPTEIMDPHFTQTAPALKLWPLAVLVFYNVSGGPFGIEPSIRAGGNFFAILGFVVFPLVWAVPEALVTAELGAAFQDPSAGVAWVEEAFGETMGGLCGYLGWVSGATDNAIYPTLFLEYFTSVAGWDKENFGGWNRFGLIASITICLSLLNYKGLEIVGKASLVVCIIAMSPFVLMTIIGAPQVVPSRWFQMPERPEDGTELFDDAFQTSPGPLPLFSLAGILWRPYLNNLFWNLNSFDGAASFAGETTCVKTTYPKGIFIGLIMCIVCYLVPLMVAVGATDYAQEDWVNGHLAVVAVDIGGNWLGAWTIFAAGISNLALFEAKMSSDAFQLMGMAERGYLPKIFAKRSKFGTPTTGIIVGTTVILSLGTAEFGQLLELLNCVYALSLLMEYAAFVKLRLYHKDMQRPYRIPIPDWAAVLIALPPTIGILVIFAISNWHVYIFSACAIALGLVLHKIGEVSKQRRWFTYETTVISNQSDSSKGEDEGGFDQYRSEELSPSTPVLV